MGRSRRLYRSLERWLLGMGMGAAAFVIERRLLRAMRSGGVEPAPRTAADGPGSSLPVEGRLAPPHQVDDQGQG